MAVIARSTASRAIYLRVVPRPQPARTLDVYDRTADFLTDEPDQAELTRNIIGTIGEVDAYRLPDAKGFASMQRYLIGEPTRPANACAKRFSALVSPTFEPLQTSWQI